MTGLFRNRRTFADQDLGSVFDSASRFGTCEVLQTSLTRGADVFREPLHTSGRDLPGTQLLLLRASPHSTSILPSSIVPPPRPS